MGSFSTTCPSSAMMDDGGMGILWSPEEIAKLPDKEPWASYIWNWKCSGGFLPSGITRCKLDRDANKTKSHLNRPL